MKAGGGPPEETRKAQSSGLKHLALRALVGCSAPLFLSLAAYSQEGQGPALPRTSLGTIGLIEMPSARMGADGELLVEASYSKNTQHYDLGFQILPWLEGSFRYSGLSHFIPSFPVYWDRSFGMKARLWDESQNFPSLAIGINDTVGTGIYSSEYLVASKNFGDLDASIGIGWGRLGTNNTFKNPFTLISRRFENRATFTTPGGTNFGTFVHGQTAGIFGGAVWRSPIKGLSLIVEASSDNYQFERTLGNFTPKTHMNYGLSYELSESATLGLNWLYGRSFGGNLAFHFDPTRPQFSASIGEPPLPPTIRSPEMQQAALGSLLGKGAPAPHLKRTANKNEFVDTLLANKNIIDVRIAGHTLSLTLDEGNPRGICRSAATDAANAMSGLVEIAVRSNSGRSLARCVVPHLPEPRLESAVFNSIDEMPNRISINKPVLTIDATSTDLSADIPSMIRAFRAGAAKQSIAIDAVSFNESEATVYFSNYHYRSDADAIERITRLLMATSPQTIEKFRLIATVSGEPQQEYNLLRNPVERAMTQNGDIASVFQSPVTIMAPPLNNSMLEAANRGTFPHFDWTVFPQMRQQFFDPTNPIGVQFVGAGEVTLELAPGFQLWAEGEISAFDTFATGRSSDSVLPHVRTDFIKYFTQGRNGIGGLGANYRTRVAPNLFVTFRAGYLESMFAGIGGEILWRPEHQRWALGADLYEVQKRAFDRLLGLQPYRTTTGHISLYYSSPWYDLDFQLRVGQYLARDRGVTLQVTRRFSTGVEIGAFFTKTNVSAAQFGEGSFDKGIIIRVPLDYIAPIESQSQVAVDLRPVQRDGGQFLAGDAALIEETRRGSEGEFSRKGISFANE